MRFRLLLPIFLCTIASPGSTATYDSSGESLRAGETAFAETMAKRDMANSATEFVAGLSVEQQRQATFAFDSEERLKWHYLPSESFPRRGISLKELNARQKSLARMLMQSGLSARGYAAATAIMELERVLRDLRKDNRLARDPEEYFISIFGVPEAEGTWGWRLEGHHLSLHFTAVEGRTSVSSPSFLGASPAEVHTGAFKGRRALAQQEDAGRLLVLSLTPAQRAQALIGEFAPEDIVTGNSSSIEPLSPAGIQASALSTDQQNLLQTLLNAHASVMADDIAAERWNRLRRAGFDKITFAWAGATERGKPHYYRVQGPTFLIEYDNTQNDANHIHTVWREFSGDFGRDLLREHVHNVEH